MGAKRFGSAATANPDTIAISAVPRMSVQSNMGPRSHAQFSAGAGTVWTAWLTGDLRVVAPEGAKVSVGLWRLILERPGRATRRGPSAGIGRLRAAWRHGSGALHGPLLK